MSATGPRALEALATGPLTTVQDLGRPGLAGMGVGRAGAADRAALAALNRLLANPADAAALEVTLGGLEVRAHGDLTLAVTGAPCPMDLDGLPVPDHALVPVPDGSRLRLGMAPAGLRTYVGVRGGIAVDPVLGSRSSDTLAGLGPAPLQPGDLVPVGPAPQAAPVVDVLPLPRPDGGAVTLQVLPGPRPEWFAPGALSALTRGIYVVSADADRVAVRLLGAPVERARHGELPSEGMVPGALQIPASGQPTAFLVDHPVTGGYPVLAVITSDDLPVLAQVRPGQQVRFRLG